MNSFLAETYNDSTKIPNLQSKESINFLGLNFRGVYFGQTGRAISVGQRSAGPGTIKIHSR